MVKFVVVKFVSCFSVKAGKPAEGKPKSQCRTLHLSKL